MASHRRAMVDATVDNATVGVDHYENFPVASWLCPPRLRPAVRAIYAYARTADDIADEGDAAPAVRLADLDAYRADLLAVVDGRTPSPRWRPMFDRLGATQRRHNLPVNLLDDLLSAFRQDALQPVYADRVALLDYCRRSANPVGRLLLHLQGLAGDRQRLLQSDAICTALQLINFWQDLSVDVARGRHYVPLADAARYGVDHALLARRVDTAATARLVTDLVDWARRLMLSGAPLVHAMPGRAGWELRLVVQGGLRILERIDALGGRVLAHRPVITKGDVPRLAWRAVAMRASTGAGLGQPA